MADAVVIMMRDGLDAVAIVARPGRSLEPAAREVFGVAPPALGRWAASGPFTILATAPGQVLVLCAGAGLFDLVAAGFEGVAGVFDLSDARTIWRVSGPAARDALATLLPIDLHPRAFAAGRAAATVAAHVNVLVWQVDDAPSYDIACARSYSGSFARYLELAAAPRNARSRSA